MRNIISYFVFGLLGLAFGIFMIAQPETIINIAAFLFSILLAARGIKGLVDTLRFTSVSKKVVLNGHTIEATLKDSVKRNMLINAFVSAAVGVLALIIAIAFLSNRNSGIMVGVVYIIAAGFLATGIIGLFGNHLMRTDKEIFEMFADKNFFYIVIGVLLILFPLLIGNTIMTIVGCVVILLSSGSVIRGALLFWNTLKDKKKNKDSEVTFEEVK